MEDFDLQDYFMNLFSIIDCNILVKFNRVSIMLSD